MFKFFSALLMTLGLTASACAERVAASDAQGFYLATQNLHRANNLPSDAAFDVEGVAGVAIRIPWDVLQPSRDRYDWTLFDSVARRAVAAGHKLSVGVVTGSNSPAWLAAQGVPFNQFVMSRKNKCLTASMPTVWNDAYVSAYVRMMQAIKDHLVAIKAYDSLEIVKITAFAQSSLELRLPIDNRCSSTIDRQWASLGYRPAKVVAAWSKIAEGVAATYPGKLIVQPILQVQGFPAVDEAGRLIDRTSVDTGSRIIDLCIKRFARRCGVQWNALKLQGRMAERVLEARDKGATISWQTNLYEGPRVGAGCQVDRRAATVPCNAATYTALLTRGIKLGATFIEVWEPDMLRYPDAFETAARDWKG